MQSYPNTPDAHPASSSREISEAASSPAPSLPVKNQSITAMIELQRAGGLPGDVLPLKILVKHTKVLRSTNGIIITFYRQGRVDWKPSTNNGNSNSNGKGKKPVREDAYPKSRTGLGVLSFGGARTNSLFRKDLSQTFAPLVVDPSTMKAAVNTSIRIPEDVFPTIKNVPNGMISFRYYVEVVMDLRGRLDRYLPTPAASAAGPASYSYSPAAQSFDLDQGRNITSTFGGNILDTDQVRREKSVVSCSIEVVIGTKDTSRKYDKLNRQRSRTLSQSQQQLQQQQQSRISAENDLHADTSSLSRSRSYLSYSETERDSRPSIEPPLSEEPGYDEQPPHGHPPPPPLPTSHLHMPRARSNSYDYAVPEESSGHHVHQQYAQPPYMPLAPPPESDEPADEKARLRQAEEALLPSQPPDDADEDQHGDANANAVTAPVMSEEDEERGNPPSFYQSSQGRLQFPLLNEDDDGVDLVNAHMSTSAVAGPSLDIPLRPRIDSSATAISGFTSTSPPPPPPPFASASSPRYTHQSHNSPSYEYHHYQARSPPSAMSLAPPSLHDSPSSARRRYSNNTQSDRESYHRPSEDKQELERRRLLAAASVPEPEDEDGEVDANGMNSGAATAMNSGAAGDGSGGGGRRNSIGNNNTSLAVPQSLTEEDFLHNVPATDTLPRYQQ